jgi:predicted component of viral defense system (DUF524 family)
MSVGIAASPSSLRPNYMLQTKFRVFIYDQKYGNHIVNEGIFNSYNYGYLIHEINTNTQAFRKLNLYSI